MEGIPVLNLIGSIILFLAKVLVVVASIIAFYKNKNIGGTLLMVGSLSILASDILGFFLIMNAGRTGPEEIVKYTGINSIISAITYFVFALGLIVYIINTRKSSANKT
ncbi:MAG: hypothetical protein AB8B59_07405 [Maribacter sp.]